MATAGGGGSIETVQLGSIDWNDGFPYQHVFHLQYGNFCIESVKKNGNASPPKPIRIY